MLTSRSKLFIYILLFSTYSIYAQPGKKDPPKNGADEVVVGKPVPPAVETDAIQLTKKLSEKYGAVKRYAFEGELEVARQVGEDPKEPLVKATVKLAVAPGGKFSISVKKEEGEYSLISNGTKMWTYVPALGQYTERALTPSERASNAQALPLVNVLEGSDDVTERFAKQIMPVLIQTVKLPATSFMRGPVLTVIGQKNTRDQQALLYLTLNATTLSIPRLTWLQPAQVEKTKYMVRLDVRFKNMRFDADVPDSDFTFEPPADAKKVDSLEIPGRKI